MVLHSDEDTYLQFCKKLHEQDSGSLVLNTEIGRENPEKNQDMKIMCEYQMTFLCKVLWLSLYCLSIDLLEVMVLVY